MSGDQESAAAEIEHVQKFGGPWSLIKTDIVDKYIGFYSKALKNQGVQRVYIDAFAGSGKFRFGPDDRDSPISPGFFGGVTHVNRVHQGSAARALRCDPPFDHVIFIEKAEKNVRALRRLIDEAGHPSAHVYHGDANQRLRRICQPDKWRTRRGVIFLDPFGMSVNWETLELIARTRALDLWFLFSLVGVVRNLPHSADRLDAGKRRAVTRVLGTDKWFDAFYKAPEHQVIPFFGEPYTPPAQRTVSMNAIERYVGDRLRTIFPHVEPPRRFVTPRNQPLFSLFFAVSNPKPAAIGLAVKAARHILKRR